MKYILITCLSIIFLFSSCWSRKKDISETFDHGWSFEKMTADKIVHIDNDSTKGMKLHLEFTYPQSFTNDTILRYVQNIFVYAYLNDSTGLTPKEAFNKKEQECIQQALVYGDEAKDDGMDFSGYYQTIVTNISDSSNIENYVTVKTITEQYTGGAHGMHNMNYFNIDTQSGDYISEEMLFESKVKSVSELVKELLIEKSNPKNENAITLLDPETIEVNGNFYFNNEGIVYVFNTYEVAPYSDGLIEVTLPYEKLKDIINPHYKYLKKKQ